MKKINHDLSARKWAITENILAVAIYRRVSTQLVRAEIITFFEISKSLLSRLEKIEKNDNSIGLTVSTEDKFNAYFSEHLQKEISLTGVKMLQLAA